MTTSDGSSKFDFKWGIPHLDDDDGFTYVPGFILRHYAALDVSPTEMMFIIHLSSFRYNTAAGKAKPSLVTVAGLMGYKRDESVRQIVRSLKAKQFLVVTEHPGRPSEYNFRGLTERCLLEELKQKHEPEGPINAGDPPQESGTPPSQDFGGHPPKILGAKNNKQDIEEQESKDSAADAASTPVTADNVEVKAVQPAAPVTGKKPNTPPVPQPPPLSLAMLYDKQPLADDLFRQANKTDQISALFAVVCWRSWQADPHGMDRGGRPDKVVSLLRKKYPDLTPGELDRAYGSYYSANEGVEMVRDGQKIAEMVGEFRRYGKIRPALKKQVAGATSSSSSRQGHWDNPLKPPSFEDVLALRGHDVSSKHWHRDAIAGMNAPSEFLWFLLANLAKRNANKATAQEIQLAWAKYQSETARPPLALDEVVAKQGDDLRKVIFLSQIKKAGWPPALVAALEAEAQKRGSAGLPFGIVKTTWEEQNRVQNL